MKVGKMKEQNDQAGNEEYEIRGTQPTSVDQVIDAYEALSNWRDEELPSDELQRRILKAIVKDQGGAMAVPVIEAVLGRKVSGEERDLIWRRFDPELDEATRRLDLDEDDEDFDTRTAVRRPRPTLRSSGEWHRVKRLRIAARKVGLELISPMFSEQRLIPGHYLLVRHRTGLSIDEVEEIIAGKGRQ